MSGRWFAALPQPVRATARRVATSATACAALTYSPYDGSSGALHRHHLPRAEDTIAKRSGCARSASSWLVALDNVARINESYGFDIAVPGHRRGRQSHPRPHARQGHARAFFSGNSSALVLRDLHARYMANRRRRLSPGARLYVADRRRPIASPSPRRRQPAAHARSVAEVLGLAQETLDAAKSLRRGSFLDSVPSSSASAAASTRARPPTDRCPRSQSGIFLAYETLFKAADRLRRSTSACCASAPPRQPDRAATSCRSPSARPGAPPRPSRHRARRR